MCDGAQYGGEVFVSECDVHEVDGEEEAGEVAGYGEEEVEEDVEERLVTEDHPQLPQVVLVVV